MTDEFLTAGVAVDNTAYHFDKLYDYVIPDDIKETARPGCRVMISFGKGSMRQGMIMELHRAESTEGLKPITELLDREPVMSEELLAMAVFMKNRTFCTVYDACCAMLPSGLSLKVTYDYYTVLKRSELPENLSCTEMQIADYLYSRKKPVRQDRLLKMVGLTTDDALVKLYKKGILGRKEAVKKRIQDVSVKMVHLENDDPDRRYTPLQTEVLNVLRTAGDVSRKEICYFTGVSAAVVDNLVKKGICRYYDAEPPKPEPVRYEHRKENSEEIILTPQQQEAYTALSEKYRSGRPEAALLYGVTGSGKTSVFMKLIDMAHADGRGVICMVPEISLTPQLIDKFRERYGNRIAVFHSGLPLAKRLEQWRLVRDGQADIAVGTRSAIFAPMKNLGLIVIDEEQEYTYKSSSTPRFHARELAKFRCAYNKCLMLLSSATPSVESFYAAEKGKYTLCTLSSRYGSAQLPHVITADMNIEQQQGNLSGYSSVLLEAIEDNLSHGHQSILLLNRRGYNTFVACRSCRDVISCPNCSISLTYHSANGRLMCHYCGYSQPVPLECPSCRSTKLRFSGSGTQRAEQEIQELFPQARILRLDTDATMQRYSYEKKLGAFRNGEYDIMLGTQMVAKGLDFENVTLVGVLSADQMLHGDDFRAYERSFSLLTQVVGRSGRGGLKGRAIIQTYEPENPIIGLAVRQDYCEFYKNEIRLRKAMLYPPFADICLAAFVGEDREKTKQAADYFAEQLRGLSQTEYIDLPLRMLGPSPALVTRVNNKYRFRLIIKFRNTARFREMLSRLLCDFGKKREFAEVTAYADIDPENSI